jgi:hypothetical protein
VQANETFSKKEANEHFLTVLNAAINTSPKPIENGEKEARNRN